MPHAMFFHDGFAIQGAPDISRLGGPVSHGGVRTAPGEPGDLEREGARNIRIEISNRTA